MGDEIELGGGSDPITQDEGGGNKFDVVADKLGDRRSDAPSEIPPPDPNLPVPRWSYMMMLVCMLAGLIFGYDIGGSGGTYVMEGFADHLGWEREDPNDPNSDWTTDVSNQQGWIGSMFTFGATVGALPSGWISDYIGRKWILFGAAALFNVGALLQIITINVQMLYAGRFIGGAAVGVLSGMTGVYTSETVMTKVRGTFVGAFQLALISGILTAGFLNVFLSKWSEGWRISYGGNIVFAIAMMIVMYFMDESPRWHFFRGEPEKCREAMRPYRTTEAEIDYEMMLLQREKDADPGTASWIEIFSPKDGQLWRTALSCILQFFVSWSGINAVAFFAPSIISSFWNDTAALWGNLGIQFAQFWGAALGLYLVDRRGRFLLLWTSGVGMSISLFILVFLAAPYSDYENTTWMAVGIILCCCAFVVFFAYGWGALGWVIAAEIHPTRTKGKAVSLATASNLLGAAVIIRLTPLLYRPEVLDLWGTFLIFAILCVVMTLFAWLCVPETNGVMTEEMVQLFQEWPMFKVPRATWIPPSQRPAQDADEDVKEHVDEEHTP